MKKLRVICINKTMFFIFSIFSFIVTTVLIVSFGTLILPASTFKHSYTRIIVVDPGHGGVDGGTSKDGVLEKDINLDISKRLKGYLERKRYKVILTRNTDISLDSLVSNSLSRHLRDLKARVNIINSSNAQLFLSIHVNCQTRYSDADGSIVLYNERFTQNKALAYCIQRALNRIMIDGKKRTVHDPQNNPGLYLLNYSNIPGAIIETAFITNQKEWELLSHESFRDEIAKAIAKSIVKYFSETRG